MKLHNRTIIIDAVFSQNRQPFDCISIMNYIRENEIQGQTFDHHEIAECLDRMRAQGLIRTVPSIEFTKYVVNAQGVQ